MNQPIANHAEPTAPAQTWGPWARGLASALIVYHLGAVLTGPMSMPPNILGDHLRMVFAPYVVAMHLDHGYRFFAPDPGPSHVIRYELEMPDGSRREGLLPDRYLHWPRLLYHRYFMLSEQMHDGRPDELFETELDPAEYPAAAQQLVYAESYARQLLRANGAARVTLYYRLHLIPPPQLVAEGARLDEPRWYRQRKLGTWSAEDLP